MPCAPLVRRALLAPVALVAGAVLAAAPVAPAPAAHAAAVVVAAVPAAAPAAAGAVAAPPSPSPTPGVTPTGPTGEVVARDGTGTGIVLPIITGTVVALLLAGLLFASAVTRRQSQERRLR